MVFKSNRGFMSTTRQRCTRRAITTLNGILCRVSALIQIVFGQPNSVLMANSLPLEQKTASLRYGRLTGSQHKQRSIVRILEYLQSRCLKFTRSLTRCHSVSIESMTMIFQTLRGVAMLINRIFFSAAAWITKSYSGISIKKLMSQNLSIQMFLLRSASILIQITFLLQFVWIRRFEYGT